MSNHDHLFTRTLRDEEFPSGYIMRCTNGACVRWWYDRKANTAWTIVKYDPKGYQIGDADYSGTKDGCASYIESACKAAAGIIACPGCGVFVLPEEQPCCA